MTKYHVHIYTMARVYVPDIEAKSMGEAIDQAYGRTNLHSLLDQKWPDGVYSEWGEGGYGDEFLVDVDGDADYEHSQHFDCEGRPMTASGHPITVAGNEAGGATVSVLDKSYYVQPDNVPGSTADLIKKLAALPSFFLQES